MKLDLRYPAISDLRARARRRIPHFVFEYLDSATGLEELQRRNERALRDVLFWPAILEGALAPDTSTRFLGRDYPLPFGAAPVGMAGIMWPRAEKILAAAMREAGLPYALSTVATVTPEDMAPHIGDDAWFQLYTPADPEIRRDMLGRARNAGFAKLVVTVDVPVDSRRERQRRADLQIPPRVTPRMLGSMAMHPAWTLGTLREGIPSLKFLESYVGDGEFNSIAHAGHLLRGQPSWDDLGTIRDEWNGEVIVKGVLRADDARRLADLGIDAIWVSNHTGRQFDGGPTAIECLPAVRRAIPDTPILYDSGIQGGLDIMRALALGADFVMLGRAFHYALGALGEDGPPHLVAMLGDDMRANMGQIGAHRLGDLPERLVRSGDLD